MKLIGPPSTAEQVVIEGLRGVLLRDGDVELLTAPKWEDTRWVALAKVYGMLCFVEVSLKVDIANQREGSRQ